MGPGYMVAGVDSLREHVVVVVVFETTLVKGILRIDVICQTHMEANKESESATARGTSGEHPQGLVAH